MKKIKYISSLVLILFFLVGCEDEKLEFGDIIAPTNIQIIPEIIGQDADNPNGNGEGIVNFSVRADDALSYNFVYNGEEIAAPTGTMTYSFSVEGVNTYEVTVIAVGAGGVTSSEIIEVDVLVSYKAADELKTALYGFDPDNPNEATSKTWRIKSEVDGHFGLGPVGGVIPSEWFGAGAGEKEGVGMYDDRWVFNSDGTVDHITNGDVFGRVGLIDELNGSGGTVEGDDVLNYEYGDTTENWAFLGPNGVETITLSGKGFIGYYVGTGDYEIFKRDVPNEMYLRITDSNAGFDWWFIITSQEEGTEPVPSASTFTNLAWQEEFDVNGAPDATIWTYDLGAGGWGNQELQTYTDNAENVIVEDGVLKIMAKADGNGGYTSARIKTQGEQSFTYGRMEIRAKLPDSQGTWPAIWMLGESFATVGWPRSGEIDIMEQRGDDKENSIGAFHWFDVGTDAQADTDGETPIENASTEFHVYSLEWTETSIKILLDGVEFHSLSNASDLPFNADFFFILNIAMGGTLGGNIATDFTEDIMEVDYIRVYQ